MENSVEIVIFPPGFAETKNAEILVRQRSLGDGIEFAVAVDHDIASVNNNIKLIPFIQLKFGFGFAVKPLTVLIEGFHRQFQAVFVQGYPERSGLH